MKRLVRVLVLVGLAAGGAPARAALEAPGQRARVEAATATPQQRQAFCRLLTELGCRAQMSGAGEALRIDLAADSRASLTRALSALAKAAQDAGIPIHSRTADDAGGVDAIACRGITIEKSAPIGHAAPRALPVAQELSNSLCTAVARQASESPPPETPCANPISLRGPPACA
jgi:hypothetical protein